MSESTPNNGEMSASSDLADVIDVSVAATSSGRGAQRRQQRGSINANHLLNFQVEGPRNTVESTSHRRRPTSQKSSRSSRPAAYDRTKFLQANFRFIISDASEIQKYEVDPDLMLNWDDIAAVDVITTSVIHCPITLSPPLCPCITPCGHIFSEEAIMAHMITQGGPELRVSSACPVCTTQVSARELRTLKIRYVGGGVNGGSNTAAIRAGDHITLNLLKRGKESIIPQPVGGEESNQKAPSSVHNSSSSRGEGVGGGEIMNFAASPTTAAAVWRGENESTANLLVNSVNNEQLIPCNLYAKFTAVSDPMPLWSHRVKILAKKCVSTIQEGGLDVTYEVPPILFAIEAMASRAKAWTERRQRLLIEKLNDEDMASALAGGALGAAELAGKEAMDALKRVAEVTTQEEEKVYKKSVEVHKLEEEFPALSVSIAAGETPTAVPVPVLWVKEETPVMDSTSLPPLALPPLTAPPPPPSSDFYFYQSRDGQLIFLCPLNMKMLVESTGGSYTALPLEITASVIELEEVEQTETTRKRLKSCCGHLPLGGSFKLCEVDLKDLLPAEALVPFEAELTQREKKRIQVAKLEARQSHREAIKAKSMAAAKAAATAGPTAAELAAMPLPGAFSEPVHVPISSVEVFSGEDDETAATGASPASSSSFPGGSSAGAGGGISFARMAKMGFAATGPALGEGMSSPPTPPWGSSPGVVSGVWGTTNTATTGAAAAWGANITNNSSVLSAQIDDALAASTSGGGGKKKGKKIMLLSTSHRR